MRDGNAHGPPARFACFVQEAVEHDLRLADRPAVFEAHEDHLVAAQRLAIPRAVLADEGAAAVLRGQQVARVEHEAERGRVRAERVVRDDGLLYEIGPRRRDTVVRVRAEPAVRPAVKPAFTHRGHVVRHEIVAQLVAFVDRRPQLPGDRLPVEPVRVAQAGGEEPRAAGLPFDFQYGGAVPFHLHTVLRDVAVRADRDIQMRAVRARDHVLRPVMVDRAGGQRGDFRGRRGDARFAALVGKTHEGIGVRDVKIAPDQRHAERRAQVLEEGRPCLGAAVAVAVAQQRDAIRARGAGPRLFHHALHDPAANTGRILGFRRRVRLGDQHVAVRQDVQPARMLQPACERAHGQPGRRPRLLAFPPADRGRDVDDGDQRGVGLGQHGIRAHAGFDRQRRGVAAGGEEARGQQRAKRLRGTVHRHSSARRGRPPRLPPSEPMHCTLGRAGSQCPGTAQSAHMNPGPRLNAARQQDESGDEQRFTQAVHCFRRMRSGRCRARHRRR